MKYVDECSNVTFQYGYQYTGEGHLIFIYFILSTNKLLIFTSGLTEVSEHVCASVVFTTQSYRKSYGKNESKKMRAAYVLSMLLLCDPPLNHPPGCHELFFEQE